jgi:hypothetical protein
MDFMRYFRFRKLTRILGDFQNYQPKTMGLLSQIGADAILHNQLRNWQSPPKVTMTN